MQYGTVIECKWVYTPTNTERVRTINTSSKLASMLYFGAFKQNKHSLCNKFYHCISSNTLLRKNLQILQLSKPK